jgi:Fe-S cluster assembly protein SufD
MLSTASRIEQQVLLRHAARGSRSRVETLALAARDARVVANATTVIPPHVTGASAIQRLHGVPTDGQPRIVLRPHLEILHDQVEARHGATWGPLPAEALFYASQRGLDSVTARALIVDGMAHALVTSCIEDDALRQSTGLTGALAAAIADHLSLPADPPR